MCLALVLMEFAFLSSPVWFGHAGGKELVQCLAHTDLMLPNMPGVVKRHAAPGCD